MNRHLNNSDTFPLSMPAQAVKRRAVQARLHRARRLHMVLEDEHAQLEDQLEMPSETRLELLNLLHSEFYTIQNMRGAPAPPNLESQSTGRSRHRYALCPVNHHYFEISSTGPTYRADIRRG